MGQQLAEGAGLIDLLLGGQPRHLGTLPSVPAWPISRICRSLRSSPEVSGKLPVTWPQDSNRLRHRRRAAVERVAGMLVVVFRHEVVDLLAVHPLQRLLQQVGVGAGALDGIIRRRDGIATRRLQYRLYIRFLVLVFVSAADFSTKRLPDLFWWAVVPEYSPNFL